MKEKNERIIDLRSKDTQLHDREEKKVKSEIKEESKKKRKFFNKKFFFILLILILIMVAEGFFVKDYLDLKTLLGYKKSIIEQQTENDKKRFAEIQELKKKIKELEGSATNESSNAGESSANNSSTEEVNKASISLEVQNGSGVSGKAATFSDKLKSLGYTIVSTKNADSDGYTNITIRYPTSKKTEAETLKGDLEKEYLVKLLELNTNSENIIVIIGS